MAIPIRDEAGDDFLGGGRGVTRFLFTQTLDQDLATTPEMALMRQEPTIRPGSAPVEIPDKPRRPNSGHDDIGRKTDIVGLEKRRETGRPIHLSDASFASGQALQAGDD